MTILDLKALRCLVLHLDRYDDEKIGEVCRARLEHIGLLKKRFPRIKFEIFPATGPHDVAEFLAENPEIIVEKPGIPLSKLAHLVSSVRMFREISFTCASPALIIEDDSFIPDDFFETLEQTAHEIPDDFDIVKFHVHEKFIKNIQSDKLIGASELYLPLYCPWYQTVCLVSPRGAVKLQKCLKRFTGFTDYSIFQAATAGAINAFNPTRTLVGTLGNADRKTSGALGSLIYMQEYLG